LAGPHDIAFSHVYGLNDSALAGFKAYQSAGRR
jgi:hypothetical protein